jgi:uncharacterized caspase-like protein
MFPTTFKAVRMPPGRPRQSMPPVCAERWSLLTRLSCILALVILSVLLVLPVTIWAASQPPTRSTPVQARAYQLAIFPWNLLDEAHLYTNIIFSAMHEAINETGLFDIRFSYYEDKDSHPEMVQKLERNIKNIWHKAGWFSIKKPHIDNIVKFANDLGVDAVLLYHAEVVFGLQAQDTLKAFLIDVHDRKIYDVTGYTADFSLGEGFREIKKMTREIFASFKLDNPPDMVIVQQPKPDPAPQQLVAKKAEEARLAALKRAEEEQQRQQEAARLAEAEWKRQQEEAARLAELKRQEEEQQRQEEAARLAELKRAEEERQRQEEAARVAKLKRAEEERQRQEEWRKQLQAHRDKTPPKIVLTSHEIGQTVKIAATTSRLRVAGQVQDPSGVAEVTVNGILAPLDHNGNFATEILLRVGDNPITVSAIDVHANVSEVQFLIQRETAVVVAGETDGPKRQQTASAQDTTAPSILLTSPNLTRSARTTVSTSQTTIIGKALDESGIVEVSVNGAMANLDREGNFSKNILLRFGDNPVELTAVDLYANVARLQFVIQRQADNALLAERMIKRYKVGKYYAMVVGNNNYQYLPKLETAVKDATEVDKILKTKYGFETELLLDATRGDMLSTLSRLRKRMGPEDNLMIYYAGHGVFEEVAQEAYWLPVDAKEDDEANWIIAGSITAEMKRSPARHVLIVADSCYSGTLTRSADVNLSSRRSREYFLKKMFQQSSRTLMASGGNEPVVDNGADGHSIFAYTFLRALREIDEPVFTAEELFYRFVKHSVAGQAEQTPVYSIIRNSGHDGGDFVFIKR